MKLNKSTEQAVYIVIILALQVNHHPLKSSLLAEILQVSDSYLKKILRKLVVAGIITSAASKDGGFQLKKNILNKLAYLMFILRYKAVKLKSISPILVSAF